MEARAQIILNICVFGESCETYELAKVASQKSGTPTERCSEELTVYFLKNEHYLL